MALNPMVENDPAGSNAVVSGAKTKLLVFSSLSIIWVFVGLLVGYRLGFPNKANEFGDFIAGIFAPAALLWLIGAVWIQSDELREQRKELILTRREFEYNREVMKAQAEEAKRQAEFIGEQTEILKEDNLRARASNMRSDIEDWTQHLRSFTISFWTEEHEIWLSGADPLLKFDGLAFLKELCFRVTTIGEEMPGWVDKVPSGRSEFEVVFASLAHIHQIANSARNAPYLEYTAAFVKPALDTLSSEYSRPTPR